MLQYSVGKKLIITVTVKERYVGDVNTWSDVDSSICYVLFLVFSFPWLVPVKNVILLFWLSLAVML